MFTIADHIQFAVDRMAEGLRVYMPLAYDVEQNYPEEYRIGRYAVKLVHDRLGLSLPASEAVGVAMNLVNAKVCGPDVSDAQREAEERDLENQALLERFTQMIEEEYETIVDRSSFAYSRYATHVGTADVFSYILHGVAQRPAALVGREPAQGPRAAPLAEPAHPAAELGHEVAPRPPRPVPRVEHLALEGPEEPLHARVVASPAPARHAPDQAVALARGHPPRPAVVPAAVGVDDRPLAAAERGARGPQARVRELRR